MTTQVRMISKGSGITAGLEIWALTTAKKHVYVLFDRSPDGRYATDVDEWNSAVSLNATARKIFKDATK